MTTLFSASISRSGGEDSRGRSSAPPLAAEKEREKKKLLSFSDDSTFSSLGLCEWICQSTSMMGFKRPTPIQRACIPAILSGHDVMGCALTGSGKTAAFALPILQTLSQDPYGIYAIVLTPTRELAIQISEQFTALGAPIATKVCLIIGGLSMTIQALELSKRPHIVIATPGRLRAHLLSCTPPSLTKAKYLILDEADRLLASGFESELKSIIGAMPKERQTLVFSATLTSSLVTLETLTNEKTLKFDLTSEVVVPSQLKQQYLFIPAQVKLSYLVCLLQQYIKRAKEQNSSDELQNAGKRKHKSKENEISNEDSKSISFSIVIFVNTCKRCQEISETLLQLQINNVCLHSVMTQSQRMNSLSKFRNQVSKILICTDVASRGLDIPNVDVVLNYDLPNVISDYIHRVGRTARAQKKGTSISFVTQYDVDMVHAIEEHIHSKLELCQEISEDHVVKVLNQVAKANRSAELKLLESGFEDKIETVLKRKKTQKKKLLRRAAGRLTGEVSATGK